MQSYTIQGQGVALFLIHGFAEDGSIWKNQVAFLKKNFTVIIPDLPGSGKSEAVAGGTIDDYAICIHEIFTKENIQQAIMIGHSMGGYIALAFVEIYPEKLLGLGLFHSSSYADDKEKIATRRKAIAVINEKGPMAFLSIAIPGLFYDKEKWKREIENLLGKGKSFSGETLIQYYEAMINRPDRTDVLKKLDVPLLIIAGKYDTAVPLEQSLKQTHLAAFTYFYILKQSAHCGMLEEKRQTENILSAFLSGCL